MRPFVIRRQSLTSVWNTMHRLVFLISALSLAASILTADELSKARLEREGAIAYNKGSEAFSAGRFAESISFLLAADSLIGESKQVDRTKLRFTIGLAYLKSEQPAEALEFFEWVAEQDSTYPYIHLQLATSAKKAGNNDKALEYYQASLAGAPDSQKPAILVHIANLLEKRKQWNKALNAYSRAIVLNSLPEYHFRRGLLYNRLAEPLDHAGDENLDFEEAINSGVLTEEALIKAIDLRQKALADFRLAAKQSELAEVAAEMIERTEILIKNNRTVISEIHYLRQNK